MVDFVATGQVILGATVSTEEGEEETVTFFLFGHEGYYRGLEGEFQF